MHRKVTIKSLSSAQNVAFSTSWKLPARIKILLHRNRTGLQKHEKSISGKVLHVLKTGENEVHVTDETRENAKRPLERMLELAK